jgi:hypothetical protein
MIENVLQIMPLWLAGIFLVLLCLLGYEAGRFIHMRFSGDPAIERPRSDAENYIIGAIFGLFAFIVGFTFSIASDRFDSRRGWVAEEATAITTMFLRAEFLDEPFRTDLRKTLREYAHTRVAPDGNWNEQMERQVELSHRLRERLWAVARDGAYPYRDSDLGGYIIEGMNDLLSVGTRRELAGTAHIPNRIFNALLLYMVVASAVLGYLSGPQANRARIAAGLLFSMMALSIVLILDLDRPRGGEIKVPQTALENLVAALDKQKLEPVAAPRP